MTYQIHIHAIYAYGAHRLLFEKTFTLPFFPTIGTMLIEEGPNGDHELHTEFRNDDYVKTSFYHYVERNTTFCDIREHWRHPVSDDTIDHIIESYLACGWKRTDDTDENTLKELMKRDYERQRKYHL